MYDPIILWWSTKAEETAQESANIMKHTIHYDYCRPTVEYSDSPQSVNMQKRADGGDETQLIIFKGIVHRKMKMH